jgi:hypothetical protein
MSGVLDEDGTQWEHCNRCGTWVRIQDLVYEKPTVKYTYGRDLCSQCSKVTKTANPSLRNRWGHTQRYQRR